MTKKTNTLHYTLHLMGLMWWTQSHIPPPLGPTSRKGSLPQLPGCCSHYGTTSVAESCWAPHTPHHVGHEQTQTLHLGKGHLWWVILALKLHLGQLGLPRGLHCGLTLARDQSYFLRLCPQMSRAPLKNPLRGCFLETWPRNDSYPWFSPRPSAATKILGGQGQPKRKINAGGRRVKKKKISHRYRWQNYKKIKAMLSAIALKFIHIYIQLLITKLLKVWKIGKKLHSLIIHQ